MPESPPAVLVSSTFYDLSQVRANLVDFITNELGYKALAFEDRGFPVDPDTSTIENCRRRVSEDTDIFVLVIGGRYGTAADATSMSVTNLEYLAARAARLPIFVFAEKSVLSYMRMWEKNKTVSFQGLVDTPLLFEFINEVGNNHKVWVHPFERAQEIVEILRTQLALLAARNLRRLRAASMLPDAELKHLHGNAFRIAVEKPRFWEFDLLATLLQEQITKHEHLHREYKSGAWLGPSEDVALSNLAWLTGRINELVKASGELTRVINEGTLAAFGPPGTPGSVKEAIYTAHRIGAIYEFAMRWSLRVGGANMHEILRDAQIAASKFSSGLVESIEQMVRDFGDAVRSAKSKVDAGEKVEIKLTYEVNADVGEFSAALAVARAAIERGEHLD